ncbi:MAG TPA: aminotransferase class IV [Chitinophagaceae bacterium]|jgi:branched-chain amino acid aminotransferase|nr:aminotransferase class IV [Chitinophagaceae bacterium]
MEFVNVNGEILSSGFAFVRTDNRSYRYGDGLFETMKAKNKKIILGDLHFERLYKSLSLLKFDIPAFFSQQNLETQILELCQKNNCEELARIRLSISRGNGSLYKSDEKFQYIIECSPLKHETDELDEGGLIIDVFPFARKSCDAFANIKSASHLPYVMAARFVKENKLNDCLLLNTYERICDSTIANLFWVKDEMISTPPLSEGCIAGVMRRYLMQCAQGTRYKVQEKPCEVKDLENADGIFLTNAIQGIKQVKRFRDKVYSKKIKIYNDLQQYILKS